MNLVGRTPVLGMGVGDVRCVWGVGGGVIYTSDAQQTPEMDEVSRPMCPPQKVWVLRYLGAFFMGQLFRGSPPGWMGFGVGGPGVGQD